MSHPDEPREETGAGGQSWRMWSFAELRTRHVPASPLQTRWESGRTERFGLRWGIELASGSWCQRMSGEGLSKTCAASDAAEVSRPDMSHHQGAEQSLRLAWLAFWHTSQKEELTTEKPGYRNRQTGGPSPAVGGLGVLGKARSQRSNGAIKSLRPGIGLEIFRKVWDLPPALNVVGQLQARICLCSIMLAPC